MSENLQPVSTDEPDLAWSLDGEPAAPSKTAKPASKRAAELAAAPPKKTNAPKNRGDDDDDDNDGGPGPSAVAVVTGLFLGLATLPWKQGAPVWA